MLGGQHAVIHPDIPVIPNNAYLVDGTHLHPGDALTVVPTEPLEVLFLPTAAPWQKLSEAVTYLRAGRPAHGGADPPGDPAVPGMYYGHFERLGPEKTTVQVLDPASPHRAVARVGTFAGASRHVCRRESAPSRVRVGTDTDAKCHVCRRDGRGCAGQAASATSVIDA